MVIGQTNHISSFEVHRCPFFCYLVNKGDKYQSDSYNTVQDPNKRNSEHSSIPEAEDE